MCFQHDGAPPHFTHAVRCHLDQRFGQTWIGHGGPIAWPAHSPDRTLQDYFLWGPHEEFGLREEDLLAWVKAVADVGLQGIGDHVNENMVCRYRVYVDVVGCHINAFL